MWIKEPKEKLEHSLSINANFLFKQDNIYVMDNHLSAGWAWLNELDTSKTYNLFHIDRHFDLCEDAEGMVHSVLNKNIDLGKLSFFEYLNLTAGPFIGSGNELPLFQWDNYIGNIRLAYPDFFGKTYFSCFEYGATIENFIDIEPGFEELIGNIHYWINRAPEKGWILNLDLDYFFMDVRGEEIQVFTDKYIIEIAHSIKKASKNIDVITICLSPEFCGGWANAIRVSNLVCNVLEIDIDLSKYDFDQ